MYAFSFAVCVFACPSLYLVIRDLLQVEMGGIDHLHASVTIISAAESAPVFGIWVKRVGLLSAALQRNPQ